ncbi:MAG: LysR family transcriptional regulator [Gammaproteobacteria bacterium]|nr:LysR family transcriptional regulator [Gammaproteobacteria bacterium]
MFTQKNNGPDMEHLSDIAVFVRIIDRGSFTAAADDLKLSKAAVSKYVGRLETRMGVRLLNRTTRRLTLTEAGEALYRRASGALSDLEAAEAEVLELAGRPRGLLRVTAPPLFGTEFLSSRICDFLHDYPDVRVDLHLDNRIADLVGERFDIAIRITTLAASSLVARRLAEIRIATAASPAYLAHHGRPAAPADLQRHECLGFDLDRTPTEWHYRSPRGEPAAVRIRSRFRCGDDAMLKRTALQGHGVLRMPELFIRDELEDGRLIRLLENYDPPPVTLAAVFPTRANLAPKVRVFVEFLAEQFGPGR